MNAHVRPRGSEGPPFPPRERLAHLPTPWHPLARLSAALPAAIDIKRDDLSGCLLSGNKIRKLEFVLADALAAGATAVVTCGGAQSNHARATAGAAARLGLRCALLLRGEAPAAPPDGNLFLDELLGAEVRWVDAAGYEDRDARMAALAGELRGRGERPYVIPEGASNEIGAWGYVAMLAELREQEPSFPWRRIVCAMGSGGTHAGLWMGARLLGLDVRVRSYLVQRDRGYFRSQVRTIVERFGRRYGVRAALDPEELEIVAGFEGPAYGAAYAEETVVIREAARAEGIVLDPVYTGKAMTGLLADLRSGALPPGERILFVHTGGIFGLMAQRGEILGPRRSR
ncbi:MAG: D-cysteine desulfhydrase family protein [Candidatus Eisenbacteria bacterium]|uniref:D-cysteine desulfhydrase family protein n=1 Tax=Eiseniibacteriota bacterium TaxID=2212470 RepID=A0A937XA91_UNCEI|nr:D-cysteine desulfhydrase family protein [Candidatus Eisenbacteria bacterium]